MTPIIKISEYAYYNSKGNKPMAVNENNYGNTNISLWLFKMANLITNLLINH